MKITIAKIIMLIVILMSLTGCLNNINSSSKKQKICEAENCNNFVVKNSYGHGIYFCEKYCEEHICKENGCGGMVQNNNNYCNIHTEEQIKLSSIQLTEVREVADKYINQLMLKHSNILAINIINDIPQLTTIDIQYRCNVVYEDSDINLATMYIYLSKEGTFEVSELEFDE